jgi:hypothetical protein
MAMSWGWAVPEMDVRVETVLTFGVTLAAEAGVIVSEASAEASFEVALTIARTG